MGSFCKIDEDGTKRWFNEQGQYHREDGPAIEWHTGSKEWYINGKHHREDGPAIEYAKGNKYWYKNGQYHREDGPAIEYSNGGKEYWYDNQEIDVKTDEEFRQYIKLKAFW